MSHLRFPVVMAGLDPPAGLKPRRRGEGVPFAHDRVL